MNAEWAKRLPWATSWPGKNDQGNINVHLDATTEDIPGIPFDTTNANDIDRLAETVLRQVMNLVRRFGADMVIVENVPYRGHLGRRKAPGGVTLRPVADPEFIAKVVESAGCGLLLDTVHARIAAYYMGLDIHDYITRLPVDRLRELHIVGGFYNGERFREHQPMTDHDWTLAAWVFANIRERRWPTRWVMAFEYGGVGPGYEERSKPDIIREQVPRLMELAVR